ncbi:hypothetical protein I553_3850 [Mycobacterium xenopi 4042]|uniref:Uncharacterized protein n=1 Tax=Mycobacterium xenopi 4042 TaxID=1299334 RepID=X8AN78_MYCXE|nr:hypothetical protein I553_3850 [Mycobacterium xenopi 4042]
MISPCSATTPRSFPQRPTDRPAATLQPPDEINDVPGSNGCYRPSPARHPTEPPTGDRPCTR